MTLPDFRLLPRRLVAGVMSGTSLDAIDVALVWISGSGCDASIELIGFYDRRFESEMRDRLLRASAGDIMVRDLAELDVDLGHLYAEVIAEAMERIAPDRLTLDAIGLHGQTIYHNPQRPVAGVTVQIGSAAVVAERFRTLVVNDFRSADVAAGGEGAPLVSYCDNVLLRHDDRNRVALNVGGIANITWLPASRSGRDLMAFDTGPGNMMIDAAMQSLYGHDVDTGGDVAATGRVDATMLDNLLDNNYFARLPPKSCGRELFGVERTIEEVYRGRARGLVPQDIVATLTQFTATTIARGITDFCACGESIESVIVGGGGWHNTTMMAMLQRELPNGTQLVSSSDYGLPSDAKEAICFALLASETLLGVPANLTSATGAARPVICGTIRQGA